MQHSKGKGLLADCTAIEVTDNGHLWRLRKGWSPPLVIHSCSTSSNHVLHSQLLGFDLESRNKCNYDCCLTSCSLLPTLPGPEKPFCSNPNLAIKKISIPLAVADDVSLKQKKKREASDSAESQKSSAVFQLSVFFTENQK